VEFLCLALSIWHIPIADAAVEAGSSGSSYSSSYGSGSRRLLAGGSSYGYDTEMVMLTPVEQMRSNINGCAFGFSLFLGLNSLIYVFRWMEIFTDP
jgi:hypothetical protein